MLQDYESIDSQHHQEHSLHSVDYQGEDDGAGGTEAVEHQDGLDSKVPWAGTIGRWYDNGKVGNDKRYEGTADTQMGCEVEAEEREV